MPVYKNSKRNSWYASFYYTTWNGERKKKKKEGFKTKREALSFEREFLEMQIGNCDIKCGQFIGIYLKNCLQRLKFSTYSTKDIVIKKYIMPFFANVPINKISAEMIRQWQLELLKKFNCSGQYLKYINAQMSCICNFGVKYYNLRQNPVKQCGGIKVQYPDKQLNFWTLSEFKNFIHNIDEENPLYTIFQLLFWTGIRRGELLALCAKDFDFDNKVLSINKNLVYVNNKPYINTPKTLHSKRSITLPDFLVKIIKIYLMKYKMQDNERLFKITPVSLNNALKRYSKKANITAIRIHDLRHSHVSLLINEGFSPLMIAERLGHKDINTTLKVYAHLYPNKQQELATKLNRIYKKSI